MSVSTKDGNSLYNVTTLETPEQSEWSDGNFISTSKTGLKATNTDEVQHLLRALQKNGTAISVAWFREGTSSCGNLGVVVPSQLVIKVNKPSSDLNNFFQLVEGEPEIFCPNTVKKIEIH